MTAHHTRRYLRSGLALIVALGGVGTALALGQASPGALLRTIPVPAGQQPTSLALDAQRGRAFVVLIGTNSTPVPAGLLMLDMATGAPLGTTPLASAPIDLAVDARQGRMFVAEQATAGVPGTLVVIDTWTGRILRTVTVPAPISWLAADAAHRRLWVASPDAGYGGILSVVDAATGRSLGVWHVRASPLAMAMDARTGRALVLSADVTGAPGVGGATYVSILDAASGRLVRRTSLPGSSARGVAVDDDAGHAYAACGPFIPIPGAPRRVVAVDMGTGRIIRVALLRHDPFGLVVDAATGRAFVAESGPWAQRLVGMPGGSMSVTLPAAAGTVTMLDRQGRAVRTVGIGLGAAAVALDAPRHRLIVTNPGARDARLTIGASSYVARAPVSGPGGVRLLDTRTGAVERTIDAGVSPFAVAVDAGRGRAVVIDAGGDPAAPTGPASDPWRWVPSALRRQLPFLAAPRPPASAARIATFDITRW